MNLYTYDGPVIEFDACIASDWHGETIAGSEKKAISNLIFQFKKKTNRACWSKISLPGKLRLIKEN